MSITNLPRYKRIVQYFWDPEPKNHAGSNTPIWCLGRRYGCESGILSTDSDRLLVKTRGDNPHYDANPEQKAKLTTSDATCGKTEDLVNAKKPKELEDLEWPKDFLDDFESRIWFTYRANFPAILESADSKSPNAVSLSVRIRSHLVNAGGFSSDTGWGCMIRSGQCLLANALVMLHLGRDWRRGSRQDEERRLLALFADNAQAPFSIHRFVQHGESACGKHPGEWFGPSATASCIQALSGQYSLAGLNVYIAGDGADVYQDSFMKVATSRNGAFTPTLILVGIRLGIDRVTPSYWSSLQASLQLPQSIGIAGGRPSSSHYFVAVQGDMFFYLDPHQTRAALPWHEDGAEFTPSEVDSCHTRRLRSLHIEEMDPSMLIGFLVKDLDDWRKWRNQIEGGAEKPIINIGDHEPNFVDPTEQENSVDQVVTFDDESDGEMVEHSPS